MFGKRSADAPTTTRREPAAAAPPPAGAPPKAEPASAPRSAPLMVTPTPKPQVARVAADTRSEDYYQIKTTIFSALIDTIDLAQLAQLDPDSAREEIRDIVNEIITIKNV